MLSFFIHWCIQTETASLERVCRQHHLIQFIVCRVSRGTVDVALATVFSTYFFFIFFSSSSHFCPPKLFSHLLFFILYIFLFSRYCSLIFLIPIILSFSFQLFSFSFLLLSLSSRLLQSTFYFFLTSTSGLHSYSI